MFGREFRAELCSRFIFKCKSCSEGVTLHTEMPRAPKKTLTTSRQSYRLESDLQPEEKHTEKTKKEPNLPQKAQPKDEKSAQGQ